MSFNLLEILGIVDAPIPANRRERIGCLMALAVVIPVAFILLLASLI